MLVTFRTRMRQSVTLPLMPGNASRSMAATGAQDESLRWRRSSESTATTPTARSSMSCLGLKVRRTPLESARRNFLVLELFNELVAMLLGALRRTLNSVSTPCPVRPRSFDMRAYRVERRVMRTAEVEIPTSLPVQDQTVSACDCRAQRTTLYL